MVRWHCHEKNKQISFNPEYTSPYMLEHWSYKINGKKKKQVALSGCMNKRHMIVTERYPKILAIHSLICSVVASLSRATDSNNDHNNYSGCLFQNTSKNQFFQNHLHLIFNDPIRYQFLSTVTTCAQVTTCGMFQMDR